MKITFVTVSAPAVKHLIASSEYINKNYGDCLDLSIYYSSIEVDEMKSQKLSDDIKNSDMVFIDLMGSPPSVVDAVYRGLNECSGDVIPYGSSAREYMRLGKFTQESMGSSESMKKPNMEAMAKMQNMAEKMGKVMPGRMHDMRNYSLLMKYFKIADRENILNMLYLILRDYGNIKSIPKPKEPREVEKISICDPKTMKLYESVKQYNEDYSFDDDKATVLMLFYGHIYPTDTSGCVDKIRNRIGEFANVLPVAISGTYESNIIALKEIVNSLGVKKVDFILNFMSFRLGAGPMGGNTELGINFLKETDASYMHPFFMSRRTVEEWRNSIQGCSSSEVLISVMLPELDGAIETFPIGAMSNPIYNTEFDILTEELEIIDERLEKLAGRVKRHIELKNKKNKDKKLAIICYNYPPGEANLFGGAFLDTFKSVENILYKLSKEGYDVNELNKDELMDIFTAGKAVNSGKYDINWEELIKYKDTDYLKEIKNYADYKDIVSEWGESPGSIMSSDNREFMIPGTIQKNVFIGLQPSRGVHEDDSKAYHDKTMPPHHQYIAFYKWLRDEFKADAIIHVGTHGTLEFLKGKECGMSGDCYPDMLLGDLPHIYLYYCGNPAESTIAKRRSHANIVSYQPPVFVQGELYGDYLKIKDLIDSYHHSLALSPQSSKEVLANIEKMAEELNLPKELDDMENELYRMNLSLIPKGLHIFGQGFDEKEGREYAKALLRYSQNGVNSLRKLVALSKGYDIEALMDRNDYELINRIEEEANSIFDYYMTNNELPNNNEYKKIAGELKNSLEYARKISVSSQENKEMDGLLHVLNDGYNEPKLAGDIYRSTEVLPAGYNLYQFDSRLIPSKTAYQRGLKISENTIEAYRAENNSYPISTAVVLWGLETSRTQGETFSQILSYLGVKLSDRSSEWSPKFNIIPIEELKRPRIDVTINICGFFRDMFPNLIEMLNDIFLKIYELDEADEMNYFKANSRKIYKKLINEGYEEKEAFDLSISRIFGPKEGGYGSGITKLFETKNWETEEQVGNLFMNNLQYVYNRKMHGKKVEGLYKENLKSVEIVSQIRSSHEYEITDLDHYYEFFGGLAKSVEISRGKKAKMYITDTTNERIYTESVEKSIARGIRTRVLNPKWIDGMLEHKYHGVQKIAQRFENVMGLAATTNSVEGWIYDDMHSCYVEDDELRKRLQENNPYAYMNILEQMMEYYNRGYWNANEEQINKIKEIYLELEDKIEEKL